jgi:hypothetical protein
MPLGFDIISIFEKVNLDELISDKVIFDKVSVSPPKSVGWEAYYLSNLFRMVIFFYLFIEGVFHFFLLLFIYAFFTTSACQSVSPVHYRSLLFSVKSCKSFKADFLQPQNKNKYSIFITCYYYLSFLLTLYFPLLWKKLIFHSQHFPFASFFALLSS